MPARWLILPLMHEGWWRIEDSMLWCIARRQRWCRMSSAFAYYAIMHPFSFFSSASPLPFQLAAVSGDDDIDAYARWRFQSARALIFNNNTTAIDYRVTPHRLICFTYLIDYDIFSMISIFSKKSILMPFLGIIQITNAHWFQPWMSKKKAALVLQRRHRYFALSWCRHYTFL